jgi:hypothetical protein
MSHGSLTPENNFSIRVAMFNGTPALHCQCKIESGKMAFCAIHGAAESLFVALEYARRFLADHRVAVPEQEATKVQTVLPYLGGVLAKARGENPR